jgi:DtxR family Mn-dependent transcriptional regulator
MTTEPDLSSPGTTSESEEMYLITVARAAEEGATGPIPVAKVAQELQISVASANEMVKKLTGRELLEYQPYRGVTLTPLGARVAERVLRTRRLWATFLAEHLGLTPQEADDQACLLEHVTLPDAVARLADFLGDPHTGPLGKPIPSTTASTDPTTIRLADLAIGESGTVAGVDGAKPAMSFLGSEGITVGAKVTVHATGASGVLVDVGQAMVHLADDLASAVVVSRG